MRWWRSITVRLAVFAALVFAVIASVAGVIGVRMLESELIEELDRSNLARVSDLAVQTELDDDVPEIAAPSSNTGAAVLDDTGFIVSASDAFDDDELFDIYFENLDDEGFDVGFDIDTIEGSESMRGIVTTAFTLADDTGYALFVATSTNEVDATVSLVTRALVVAVPVLTLLVGLLVYLMARRSLRSVERLRRDVESFGGDDLGRRLPEPEVDDELGRLAHTMNGMLERVEESSERQRRFAADASHELRSPLASMVAQLEVDLAHPDAARWQETARSLQTETTRMQRLVDDLLLLARRGAAVRGGATSDAALGGAALDDGALDGGALDGGALDGAALGSRALGSRALDDRALDDRALDDVAIDDLIVDAVGTAWPRANAAGVELLTGDLARVTVASDADALRRILDNLLANAIRHADSIVHVTATTHERGLAVRVDDDGGGIAPEDRNRVFDRFVRLDEGRSRDEGGSGLGLAICRELAEQLGGSISVIDSPLGGARFEVELLVPSGSDGAAG